jgi:subtilisin family serine protease
VLAVIDTGINYEHEDLRDNLWLNPAEIAAAEWQSVDGTPTLQGDIYTPTVSTDETETFFRLSRGQQFDPHNHQPESHYPTGPRL